MPKESWQHPGVDNIRILEKKKQMKSAPRKKLMLSECWHDQDQDHYHYQPCLKTPFWRLATGLGGVSWPTMRGFISDLKLRSRDLEKLGKARLSLAPTNALEAVFFPWPPTRFHSNKKKFLPILGLTLRIKIYSQSWHQMKFASSQGWLPNEGGLLFWEVGQGGKVSGYALFLRVMKFFILLLLNFKTGGITHASWALNACLSWYESSMAKEGIQSHI